ncbi:MAG: pantetheine-phosphate adenylyltransferase [Planctomycetaceae bacterium]|nr:pantetheine-phosphate adenylyltransferase [Planctomycetaceae bacterium]
MTTRTVMAKSNQRIAVFPGTFDPVHLGHIDLIERSAALFDRLVVGIGENPEKTALMDLPARKALIENLTAHLGNVTVEIYRGLTVAFAQRLGAGVILRGIRHVGDLDFEMRMAVTNRSVSGLDTLFIMASPQYLFLSSSLIKQIAAGGGDVASMVPPEALQHLKRKAPGIKKRRQGRGA